MNRLKSKIILFITIFFSQFFLLSFVFAQGNTVNVQDQINAQLGAASNKAEVSQAADPRAVVASIVKVLLTLFGTIFFVLLVMSSYWLITARGEEDKITKAKDTIRSAIIGLIIVLMAYAITIFITARLLDVT